MKTRSQHTFFSKIISSSLTEFILYCNKKHRADTGDITDLKVREGRFWYILLCYGYTSKQSAMDRIFKKCIEDTINNQNNMSLLPHLSHYFIGHEASINI